MKRYIRLKDGQIIDTEHKDADKYLIERILGDSVIAESDTITDLIMIGDLVIFKEQPLIVYKHNKLDKKYCDKNVTQIYTKQQNDYILVWDEELGLI